MEKERTVDEDKSANSDPPVAANRPRQADRRFAALDANSTIDQLMTVEAEDIRSSRVL